MNKTMKTKKKLTKKVVKKTAKKAVVELTPEENERCIILNDAIAQVEAEVYLVLSGNGYVVNEELDEEVNKLYDEATNKNTQFQKYIDKLINKKKPCEVCAKGALFLSAIRKFNNVSLEDIMNEQDEYRECGLAHMASNRIQEIFGEENADTMEDYFENGHDECSEDGEDDINPWLDLSDTERLLLILKNALENKGIFMPEQVVFKEE